MTARNSGYVGLLFATFLALVWVMWSGLAVMLPESEEPTCECNPDFHLISHRGGAAMAPENTIAAFEEARKISADISMDLSVTSDGELVLMHDDYVDRTTDGHGLLCEMSLRSVQQLDAGSWFSPDYAGERIPTLTEVFDTFGNTTLYHMDLKKRKSCVGISQLEVVDKVVQVIWKRGLQKNVAFTVEDAEVLTYVKRRLPDATILASINVLYTLAPLSSMWAFVDKTGADGVSAHFLMPMLKNVLVEAKKRQKKVVIYTVDSMYVSRWLECLGVDGIITNFPNKIMNGAKCPIYSHHQSQSNQPDRSFNLWNGDRRGETKQIRYIDPVPAPGHWIPL